MAAKRTKLSDQVRRAVKACGTTRYRLWQQTGIDQSTLSKFVNGKAAISMEALDKLADLLELNVTAGKAPANRKGR